MKYRYIITTEDGEVRGSDTLTHDMQELFELGIINIVDCTYGLSMTDFREPLWETFDKWVPE